MIGSAIRPRGLHVSLQTRVTALVVLAVTAIAVGKGAFDLYTNTSEREAATAYHLHMVTSMAAKALARPLWDYNVEQVTSILAGLARERLAIGDKIAMEGCRQLDGQLDRLVVRDRSELQLRHGGLLTCDRVREPDRE